jgi:hypothetical protein
VRWNLIRQLHDYDRSLEGEDLSFVGFYSPDFHYHIDVDKVKKSFAIKDTILNKDFKQIPIDLMTYDDKTEEACKIINRIQWIDNRLLRICSKEGVEKIVDF